MDLLVTTLCLVIRIDESTFGLLDNSHFEVINDLPRDFSATDVNGPADSIIRDFVWRDRRLGLWREIYWLRMYCTIRYVDLSGRRLESRM
jgi:hypothetical protein